MIRKIDSESKECREFIEKLFLRRTLIPEQVLETVSNIIDEVREKGDDALLSFTLRFDGVEMDAKMLKVSVPEMEDAVKKTDASLLRVIARAAENIRKFHERQKSESWFYTGENGEILGQRHTPMERVGIYVPGGTAPLVSSVLMTAIPAKVAGVERVIMATPPQKDGSINPAVLAAAQATGVDEVYRIGGAQAVAAMAFGTETIPWVDKIVGPGNIYVATAKKLVYGTVGIDMVAGPSEITVIADDTAKPEFVAADLLSQAEHDEMAASILLTDSDEIAEAVVSELRKQLQLLDRRQTAEKSLRNYGAIIVVNGINSAVELANMIAPEHLELCVREPFRLLGMVKNAGAVFLGSNSPEPVGDYIAGPNHVLPTGGTARFFSPLGVYDFIKRTSVIYYTPEALASVTDDVIKLAEAEGLDAHANSVRTRSSRDTGSDGNKGR
jgi:histidinol dehydrogenase